jgi:hypothetical protein
MAKEKENGNEKQDHYSHWHEGSQAMFEWAFLG